MKKVLKKILLVVITVAMVAALITAKEVLKRKNLQLRSEIGVQKKTLIEAGDKQRNITPENILTINEYGLHKIKDNVMQIRVDDG